MCGIAGFIACEGTEHGSLVRIATSMADTLAHRGPDDSGVWSDPATGVALAFRRLSILDRSPAGHQPMRSSDGRYVIVFNGEIYNFSELRKALEQSGEAPDWRGHSDTEVLLALIAARGIDRALEQSIGMFAFALWDSHGRTLHLARDRLGEKPLYYGWAGRTFLFGSELKALRAHPHWDAEIDRGAVALFMRYNYVPAPHSIYRGISKLAPGHSMSLAWRSREPIIKSYWSARTIAERGFSDPFSGGAAAIGAALDTLLRDVIGKQMVADVPLGAFLSGGIDSSTVVALMQAQSMRPVKTFTIGFHEQEYNEAVNAAEVARHLGTDHTELYVTPQQAMEVIPKLPAMYDEPFSDSSQIPTFLVAQLARSQVTVALSGDGGDELFAGYTRYVFGKQLWSKLSRLPPPIRRSIAAAIKTLSVERWNAIAKPLLAVAPKRYRIGLAGDKIHKLADVLVHDTLDSLYRDLVSHWKPPLAIVLADSEPATMLDSADGLAIDDPVARMMLLDLVTYLPDDILTKVDRAAMSVSLETRIPLLDHRVVEFASKIPLAANLNRDGAKGILRNVLYRYVPRALVDRPKMGFAVPIDSWLRGPLQQWADELLDPARLRREGYLKPELIQQHWQDHKSGRRNLHYPLWDVLMFQSWLQSTQR
ncbi:MAG: asparagine synthase (glutamine-hydrolyzing) [Burkholderiaceae bacterium]|nr:asparagine synthase (glutamine-hydrolyzing) [Burkholderiaceae bacterium]